MDRVEFELKQFPRFRRICMAMWAAYDQRYDDTFKEHGFTTVTHSNERWSLSEEEFIWFVLKWSGEING